MPTLHKLDPEGRYDSSHADEHLWWPRVLWIDPGTVSGVAIVWFDPKALFSGAPLPRALLGYSEMFLHGPERGLNGQVNRFIRLQRNLDAAPGLATGCEKFTIRQMNQSEEFLSPVRIGNSIDARLSVMKPYGEEHVNDGIPLYWQTPSEALTTFTNPRLQALQMYTPGPDHVNDAKRHALLWLRKLQHGVQKDGMEFFSSRHGYEKEWFE